MAVGHLHAPTSRERQRTAHAAFVALGRHFAAVELTCKTIFVDARDGVIDGEAGRPSRDGFDFLLYLCSGSRLVVETAVEAKVLQVLSGDIGLGCSRKGREAHQ